MAIWLDVLGWPPSIFGGAVLIVFAVLYGLRAKLNRRPYLLAIQIGLASTTINALANTIASNNTLPSELLLGLLSIKLGTILGFAILGWLIIRICFIIRLRNEQSNIFTRNRRS